MKWGGDLSAAVGALGFDHRPPLSACTWAPRVSFTRLQVLLNRSDEGGLGDDDVAADQMDEVPTSQARQNENK
jgi:hypothetical protein